MSQEIADKAINMTLRNPSRYLKVEFQDGESLLNLPLIRSCSASCTDPEFLGLPSPSKERTSSPRNLHSRHPLAPPRFGQP